MNYEKVILEMLTRIKDLEEKVDMLQEYQQELQNKDEGEDDVTSGEEKRKVEGNEPAERLWQF